MKNGQKEPFQPVQESTLGTKIKDVFGTERTASGPWDTWSQSLLSVSPGAADLCQPIGTDMETAALA